MARRGSERPSAARRLSQVGVVVALLVVAAAALPRGFSVGRRGAGATVLLPDTPAVAAYLVVAIGAVLVLTWSALRVSAVFARREAAPRKATPLWVQLFIVVLALLLPGLLAETRGLFDERGQDAAAADRERAPEARPGDGPARSRELGLALTALLGAILVGLIGGVAWLFWPARREEDEARPEPHELLLTEIDAGMDDLSTIEDPRAAVIAAYARMETLLARAGIARRPSDTPIELLARVLRAHRAAESSITRLTELFERARFSSHEIDEPMRRSAVAALGDIRDEIGAPV
ncbi:MAG: DUF4129 domain-containing protein [Actinomycetota bacterium]